MHLTAGATSRAISCCSRPEICFFFRVSKLKLFLTYWLPTLLWMALIFGFSSDGKSYQHSSTLFEPLLRWLLPHLSPAHVEAVHHLFRKGCHLTEYAILTLLVWRALVKPQWKQPRPWIWNDAALALALVFCFACSDEFHQIWVPGRTALFSDVLIDTTGGAIALLLLWPVRKLFVRPMT
jgi:VanZ family protein